MDIIVVRNCMEVHWQLQPIMLPMTVANFAAANLEDFLLQGIYSCVHTLFPSYSRTGTAIIKSSALSIYLFIY